MKRAVISYALLAAFVGASYAQAQEGPVSARVQFSEKCARTCENSKCLVGLTPREYNACRSKCFTQCAKRQ
jgi:hypothetical protein